MPESHRRTLAVRLIGWGIGAIAVAFALWTLRGQWSQVLEVAGAIRPAFVPLLISVLAMAVAYVVLIATWKECVADAGSRLTFRDSTRIWFVSNLARYLPGALWQIGALAILAKDHGSSASAATSSALVVTLLNTLAGIAIVLVCSTGLEEVPSIPWGVIAGAVFALVLLRWGGPYIIEWMTRITRRQISLPELKPRTVAVASLGSVLAWLLYGVAFHFLVISVMPSVELNLAASIAIYGGAYLAGFLSLGPPAGIGVAEAAMIYLLTVGGAATGAEAAVIAAVTRLWRTLLEILPGLVMIPFHPSRGNRIP